MVDVSRMGPAELAAHMAKLDMVEETNVATAQFRGPKLAWSVDEDAPKPNGKLVLRPARLPDPKPAPAARVALRHPTDPRLRHRPGGARRHWQVSLRHGASASRWPRAAPFLGDHIFTPVNVAIINLDDPMDELERRVAAVMLAHRISARGP